MHRQRLRSTSTARRATRGGRTAGRRVGYAAAALLAVFLFLGVDSVALAATEHPGFWRDTSLSGTAREYYGVDYCAETQTLWVVGMLSGTPSNLSSSDGGETWSEHALPAGHIGFYDVACVGASTIWAVGEDGAIVHSSDGGATWTKQVSGTSSDLVSIAWKSEEEAWVVGESGVILYTSDGGANWNEQTSHTTLHIQEVCYGGDGELWATATTSWLDDAQTQVLYTEDGGLRWTKRWEVEEFLWSINCVNGDDGATSLLAVGQTGDQKGVIYASDDGGQTWQRRLKLGSDSALRDVCWADESTAWAVGWKARVFYTTDGGASWTEYGRLQSDETWMLYDVTCAGASAAWTAGGTLVCEYSSWIVATTGLDRDDWRTSPVDFGATAAFDPEYGLSSFEYSIDGGATWSDMDIGSGAGNDESELAPKDEATGVATISADGVHTVLARVTDGTGRTGTTEIGTVKIDQVAPTIAVGDPVATDDGSEFVLAPTVGASGLAGVEYRLGEGGWTPLAPEDGAYSLVVPYAEQETTICFRVTNNAGVSTEVSRKVPYIRPVVTVAGAASGWSVSPVHLSVAATVHPALTVAALEYSVDEGASWTEVSGSGAKRTLTISDDGTHHVLVRVTDSEGRTVVTEQPTTVRIDQVDPRIIVRDAYVTPGQATTLSFAVEAGASGIVGVEYRLDQGSWTTLAPYAGAFSLALPCTRGEATVHYRATNYAGTVSSEGSYAVTYGDPTVTVAGAGSGWRTSSAVLTVSATVSVELTHSTLEYSTDGGGSWAEIPGSGATRALTVSGNGRHDVLVGVTDLAGQTATAATTVNIDAVKPAANAKKATWKRGRAGKLKLYVTKQPAGCGAAKVLVKIYKGKKLKRTVTTTYLGVNTWQTFKVAKTVTKRLAKGQYTLQLTATDQIGNVQAEASTARLTVK